MLKRKTQYTLAIALVVSVASLTAFFLLLRSPEPEDRSRDPRAIEQYLVELDSDDYVTYTDPIYGFSFPYPSDFSVRRERVGEADTVFLDHPRLNMGIRIRISRAGPGELSKEELARKFPAVPVEDIWEFSLSDGTPTLRFRATDPSLGNTRKMWFARDGYLYQTSLYAAHDEWLDAWIRELASKLEFSR